MRQRRIRLHGDPERAAAPASRGGVLDGRGHRSGSRLRYAAEGRLGAARLQNQLGDRGVRGCVRHSVGRPDGEESEEPAGADGGAGAEFGDDECGAGRNPGTEDEYGRNEGAAGKRRKIREGGVFVGKKRGNREGFWSFV